jgi:hypothetical protein
MPDSGFDTISLRDDRPTAKQAASERATIWRRSERAACLATARYPIYGWALRIAKAFHNCQARLPRTSPGSLSRSAPSSGEM